MDNPFFLTLGLIVSVFFGIVLPLWALSTLRAIRREAKAADARRTAEARKILGALEAIYKALTAAE
jgi:hypothetical protein